MHNGMISSFSQVYDFKREDLQPLGSLYTKAIQLYMIKPSGAESVELEMSDQCTTDVRSAARVRYERISFLYALQAVRAPIFTFPFYSPPLPDHRRPPLF